MKMEISYHAKNRFDERCINPKNSLKTYATRALASKRTSPALQYLMSKKRPKHLYKLLENFIFIFEDQNRGRYRLKTLIPDEGLKYAKIYYNKY